MDKEELEECLAKARTRFEKYQILKQAATTSEARSKVNKRFGLRGPRHTKKKR